MKAQDLEAFNKDLQDLINRHSLENLSDTPDFILAAYLSSCLLAFGLNIRTRDNWYGYKGLGQRVNETSAPGLVAVEDDFPLGEACSSNPSDCEACQ